MSERTAIQMVTASVLGSLLFFTVSFAEEEKTVGQEVVVFDEASNKEIKYCDSTMTEMCECRKGLSDNPENAVPANECVLLNIGLGRARYSALTESIMLQLNELVPNSALYSPSGFKVVAGYAVYGVSREKNASNVPKYVQITDPSGVITRFLFSDGESVAVPFAALGNRTDGRLAMVDAEGWATAADPAYYVFYPGDGSLWRFGASPASAEYLRFVFHQTAQGRVETPQDMGVEIIRDADGVLRQVMTPAWLADFVVTGQDGYDLRLYPHDASCVPGTRSADGSYVIAQGAAPDAVWEFRNPQPGVPRELSVTRKRGDVSETWLYRYEEAVQDFTLVYPQGVMVKRLERVYSDDKKSWTLKRTLTASDGRVVRAEQKHFVNGVSGSLLTESVRDPEGLKLVKRYDYYQDTVLNRLLKATVNEDGSWSRYEYDGQRRKIAEIRPWLDTPTNAPDNQCAVTRYGYGLFAAGDFLAYNDQRPRTEIKEICGVEVSRTYHAYLTNALGQAQEIEERAASSGAPYGHASNPRTVKTYYAANAALPLPGRLAMVVYPGGKTETYGYEYGTFNAATFVFTPDPDGGAWRETVTTSYGANSGVQALRSARVWDEKGREVLDESYVEDGGSFALIGWKRMSYDRNGKLIETAYSDGRVVSATWGANCCGKESETSSDGIITVYGYNALKQKVSETKKGLAADGSDDITTLYTYDLESRVLSTAITNVASGLGYVASRNAYDAVGRVTNAVDRLGNPTVTAYDSLATSVHRPNGVTAVTERYLDGQAKRVLENGTVKQSYAYGVSPDNTRWTLSAQGELPATIQSTLEIPNASTLELLDFPWSISVTDPIGRSVFTHKPGFGGTVLVTSNAYDIAGNLLFSAQFSVDSNNPINPVILSKNIYSYVADGSRLFTALDLNTNGMIDLSGPDRITGSATVYEKDAFNSWWLVSRSWVYPEFNSALAITTSVQRVKLTGLGFPLAMTPSGVSPESLLTSFSESIDIRSNVTVSSTLTDRSVRKVAQVTSSSYSVQPAVRVIVNGLLQYMVSVSTVTNKYVHDPLGRQFAITDGRGNASVTVYNLFGQVAYAEDAASNRTSYAYDKLGRRVSFADALDNVTHTSYDAEGRVIKNWGATYPVEYGYDLYGRKVSMKTFREDGVSDETRWLYDNPTGLLTNKVSVDGKGPSFTYTPDGKLATRLWARGIASDYFYDAAGQLNGVKYGRIPVAPQTPNVAYAYNRIGRQVSAITSVSTNLFTYSTTTLEIISETQNGVPIIRNYDSLGRTSGFAFGEDYGVSYLYDAYGRIKSVVARDDAFSSTNTYFHIPGSGLSAGKTAGPLSLTKTYELARDLLTQVRSETGAGVISQYDYFSDAVGRRARRIDSTPALSLTNSFGYNMRSEVTDAVLHTNSYSYDYDHIGNRLFSSYNAETNTYAANMLNQYTSIVNRQSPVIAASYDPDGNMTTNGVWSYTWDAENRLASVSSNGFPIANFSYDYQSRRVSKRLSAGKTDFLYDGWAMIREKSAPSNELPVVKSYYYGLDLSGTLQDAGAVGGLWLGRSGFSSWYYTFDANGNVSEILNEEGIVIGHYEYDPFGNIIGKTGTMADITPFRFSTKYLDIELGLYYYGYRYYIPDYGRWLNMDPLEEKGGLNLYQFALNTPYDKFDALGLWNPLYLDLPATPSKCSYVAYLISFWANIDAHNACLWYQYITGGGMLLTLDYSWFDPSGIVRLNARNRVKERAQSAASSGGALACNESVPQPVATFSSWGLSPILMIFQWAQTTEYELTVIKNCDDCDRCKSIDVAGIWKNTANDRIDWNTGMGGGHGWVYPPAFVSDQLVNACSFGTDYPINAKSNDSGNWTFACP